MIAGSISRAKAKPIARRATRRELERELHSLADVERARNLRWFFKTGPGEYGEGDEFLGIRVPDVRRVAHKYIEMPLSDVALLLHSPLHEVRFAAAELLVAQYEQAVTKPQRAAIYRFYLANAPRFNNWDLVDTSAREIVGEHLKTRPRTVLNRLAKSKNVWERRIAIVATMGLHRAGETADTYRIAEKLLDDSHDLIHKAVGWALREAGRVSRPELTAFLKRHYARLPRTTLRYAIEHFSREERTAMLAGRFDEKAPAHSRSH